jgi:hypothetical protein
MPAPVLVPVASDTVGAVTHAPSSANGDGVRAAIKQADDDWAANLLSDYGSISPAARSTTSATGEPAGVMGQLAQLRAQYGGGDD